MINRQECFTIVYLFYNCLNFNCMTIILFIILLLISINNFRFFIIIFLTLPP